MESILKSIITELQSKPVYSNHFFAAENGKNKPIVRKNRRKLTQNVYFLQIKDI